MTADPILSTLAPGVHRARVPMPGAGLSYNNAYLIEDALGWLHIVDPGSPRHARETLIPAIAALGRRPDDVASVVVTHLHPDHAGGAAELRSETGAVVLLHERERVALRTLAAGLPAPDVDGWGVPPERRPELSAVTGATGAGAGAAAAIAAAVDATVADGDLLDIPGRRIHVVGTPGHTPGHLCLHDVDARLVFTGDHVLPTINSGLGLGGPTASNPIEDYLGSLARIAELDAPGVRILPGHEEAFGGLSARCAALAEHHLRRAREVAAHPGGSVWQIASSLTWTGGWEALTGLTLLSALSQTVQHLDFVARGGLERWDAREG